VDVANVMGSRPDGWWRDRAGAAVRLYSELADLAASGRAGLPGQTGPPDAVGPRDARMPPDTAGPEGAGTPPDAAGPKDAGTPPDAADPPEYVMVLEGAARAAAAGITSAEAARGRQDAATGPGQVPPGRIRVVQARGSGDDAIVDLVRELPGRRVVVTADRALRDRCAAAGATVLGPAWLLAQLRP
jgi:8-oxo-dGTP diphosphatase